MEEKEGKFRHKYDNKDLAKIFIIILISYFAIKYIIRIYDTYTVK